MHAIYTHTKYFVFAEKYSNQSGTSRKTATPKDAEKCWHSPRPRCIHWQVSCLNRFYINGIYFVSAFRQHLINKRILSFQTTVDSHLPHRQCVQMIITVTFFPDHIRSQSKLHQRRSPMRSDRHSGLRSSFWSKTASRSNEYFQYVTIFFMGDVYGRNSIVSHKYSRNNCIMW